jgi:hypothetical protein
MLGIVLRLLRASWLWGGLFVTAALSLGSIVTGIIALRRIRRADGGLQGEENVFFAFTFLSIWLIGIGLVIWFLTTLGTSPDGCG